ncbi:hypothetical protein [Leifsonia sp. AG29]|uniref:hypothetical protein n=1 Tax=Leifsonia sp. AG29 TaxID=2598860 RepID=UPI00131BF961|nr:hypothetical protein [Leifsonia sp. AG29]
MDLREAAEELYATDPSDFVARRSAAAAGADRDVAKEIRKLRKPSAAAAAINALVREHPDLVGDVLEVGDRMREAFAARDREKIRALTQERQRLLQRATADLGLSPAVQREVEETLQAAVIDAAAAAAVRSGMLVRGLESTGVDQVDVTDAVALPVEVPEARPVAAEGDQTEEDGSQAPDVEEEGPEASEAEEAAEAGSEESPSARRERQRRLRAAERAVERARADAESLDDELDEELERRGDLEAERSRLQRRLQRVADDLAESRPAERDLRARIREAQRAVRDAERDLRSEQE